MFHINSTRSSFPTHFNIYPNSVVSWNNTDVTTNCRISASLCSVISDLTSQHKTWFLFHLHVVSLWGGYSYWCLVEFPQPLALPQSFYCLVSSLPLPITATAEGPAMHSDSAINALHQCSGQWPTLYPCCLHTAFLDFRVCLVGTLDALGAGPEQ